MSSSTPRHPRDRTTIPSPAPPAGYLGWICAITVLALAGAGLNLYRYLSPAVPHPAEMSPITQPGNGKQSSTESNLKAPSRTELPDVDPHRPDSEIQPVDPVPPAGNGSPGSPPDGKNPDSASQNQPPISEGRRRALAEVTQPPAPPTVRPVVPKTSAPSPPAPEHSRKTALPRPRGPEPPETATPPNQIPPQAALEPAPPSHPGKTVPPISNLPNVAALLQGGYYRQASTRTLHALQGSDAQFTISLEVACRPQTVQRGLEQSDFHPDLYLLPRKVDQQSCYALLWGLYPSAHHARRAMEMLPAYFARQTPPPRVSVLGTYLH